MVENKAERLRQEERVTELMGHIDVLVRQFLVIHQNLNKEYADITKQELNIIAIVGRAGACIMREIAERAQLSTASVTSIVDRLEEKKLARRVRSKEDRRIAQVELSAKGDKIFQIEMESYKDLSLSIMQTLSESEQETFLRLFRKVTESLSVL